MRRSHKVVIERMEERKYSDIMFENFSELMEDSERYMKDIHTYTYCSKSSEHHSLRDLKNSHFFCKEMITI